MSNYYDAEAIVQSPEYRQELAAQRTFMAGVYGWMTIGLLITALTALVVASSKELVATIFTTGAFWVLLIAEVGIAMAFRFALRAVPVPVAAAMFLVYSALTGATLSILLLVYTQSSVASTFFVTAGMFAGASAYGYVTKRDLTSIGSFLMMGVWGLLIASVVNIFVASSAMDWLISFIGVAVFTGLAGYQTQMLKQSYADAPSGSVAQRKTALLGAFALYLDFINLFVYLLRFMGNRRN